MKRILIIILACIAVFSCIQMIQQQSGKDTSINQDTVNPEMMDEEEIIETMTDSEIDKDKTKKVESKQEKTLDLELQLTE